jgi:thiol-disulfide isomerase/thioredoxin
LFAILLALLCLAAPAVAGDTEYTGKFDAELAADAESTRRIVFTYVASERMKGSNFSPDAHLSTARIYDFATDTMSIQALLVEEEDKLPVIFVDLNNNKNFSPEEKFTFKASEKYGRLYNIKINIPMSGRSYPSYPTIIEFHEGWKTDKMTDNDRLIEQSDEAYARGTVDVKGKKLTVQYIYDFLNKRVDPLLGTLGVDANGDGEIDMDPMSPEAMMVKGEAAIFRVDNLYLSTKKLDLEKNLIVLKEQSAKDYQRVELSMGNVVPDFNFVDLNGKKRKFSEFRGKYVLLDIWGFWCPACLDELPYLKSAYEKFQSRNFEIVGLNTDEYAPEMVKKSVDQNGMKWTHASRESIISLLGERMMIRSFPTTMLISPEGKILSRGKSDQGEPDLRGADLLKTLDELLPKAAQ